MALGPAVAGGGVWCPGLPASAAVTYRGTPHSVRSALNPL
jgi:hypothetical protein